jgi:hypothetical protein
MKLQLALSCAVASIGFLTLPLFSGNDIFPETRICFRPETILSEKNQHLKKCDSNERVAVILSSVFRDLDKTDIEFHNKVADNPVTKHFDNNLTQSQISQIIAIALGVGGVSLFSSLEKEVIENKNSAYQKKRVGILTSEATAHQQLYGFDSQTPALQQELKNQTFIRDVAKLQSESAEYDQKTAEHKAKIKKSFGVNESKTDSTPESTDQALKTSLIDALKEHEGGWIWKIVDNATPLWLIGRQGSSKTWTSCVFSLIRKYCLGMPVRFLIDEHAKGVNSEIWRYLEPKTTTSDIENMTDVFDSIVDNWKLRIEGKNEQEQKDDIQAEQIIVDEYTALKNEVGESADKFYRRHLKDTRKAKSFVIGVTHNDTNSAYPEGTKEQRDSGTILIQKFSANGKTPLPRVKIIRGLFDEDGNELLEFEGTIPDWFTPQRVFEHFNGNPIEF